MQPWRRALLPLAIALILLMAGLRWARLSADPPQGLTWSGALYTDEGWYARNALAQALRGTAYLPGDFNPMVAMPVWNGLLVAAFRFAWPSLAAARAVSCAFSLWLIALVYALMRRYVCRGTALIGCLIVASHYRLFAYSRLALMEPTMTAMVLLSWLLAARPPRRGRALALVASGLAYAAALLTKQSAISAAPLMVAAVAYAAPPTRKRWLHLGLWLVAVVAALVVWYGLLLAPYPEDRLFLVRSLVGEKLGGGFAPARLGLHLAQVAYAALQATDPLLGSGVAVGSALLLASSARFRREPLVRLTLLWALGLMGLFTVSSYAPPRYLLPLIVPMAMLAAWMVGEVRPGEGGMTLRPAMVAILALSVATNAAGCVTAIWRAEDSLTRAAVEIADLARRDAPAPALLGKPADTLALVNRLPAVTESLGAASLEAKLAHYRPTHYVSLGPISAETAARLAPYATPRLLGRWDVYHHYTGGWLHLYALDR